MTDQEIRIAIAEARGLFRIMPLRRTTRRGMPDENGVRLWYCSEHHGGAATYEELPDYPNDLNATHEVEKWLKHEYRGGYFQDPTQAFSRYEYSLYIAYGILPTARQRCEALLKTLNLWKDDI